MKNFLSFCIFFLCIVCEICTGDIQRIRYIHDTIDEVQTLIDQGIKPSQIVVAFDLDDTLVRTYISDNFAVANLRRVALPASFLHEYIEKTSQDVECIRYALGDFHTLIEPTKNNVASFADLRAHDVVLHAQEKGYLKLEVVEKTTKTSLGTVHVIEQLHCMGIRILAITARTWYMSFMTDRWLQSLGIILDSTPDLRFEEDADGFCGVRNGGIYVKWNVMNKGKALTLFFDKTDSWPEALLIVDDNHRFLERAEVYFTNPESQGGKITKKYLWYDFAQNTPSFFACEGTPSPVAEGKGRQAKTFLESMLGEDWVYTPVAQPWLKS